MADKALANVPRVLGSVKELQQFLAMNKKVVGRDKVYRVIQYVSRFLAWFIPTQTKGAADLVAKLKKLESHLSIGRKLIRLYKCVEFAVDVENALIMEKRPIIRALAAAEALCKTIRMAYDHVHWAIKIGLLPTWNEKRFARTANIFWLAGLVATIAKNAALLDIAKRRETRARKDNQSDAADKAAGDQRSLSIAIFRDCCDLPVPMHSLDYLPGVSPGFPAFTGSIASIIGLWEAWKAAEKEK